MQNHETQKFLKQVKNLLPILSKQEKRFLKDLENGISEYFSVHPNSTVEDIANEFGTPNDIVHDYIESIDLDYIIKRISTRRIIRRALICIVMLAFIVSSAFIGSIYSAYLHSLDSVITQEVTVIE